MSRRANGEGTIYQRKDGRWEGSCYVLLPSGGRARRSVYGRTRAEVREKMTALQRESDRGAPVGASGTLTVGDYLEAWLRDVAAVKVRPATLRSYEMYVRRHLVPGLGRKRLSRLSPADVRAFLADRRAAGLAPASVKQVHAILRAALQHAVREDVLPRNVARLVVVPNGPRHEWQPLSVEEARALLDAARGDRLYALWAVALAVGLRRGEALGLRWCDVNLDEGLLRVRQTLQRTTEGLVFVPPKSERSRRTVPLPAVAKTALREHRRAMVAEALLRGRPMSDDAPIFVTSIGTPMEPRNINRAFVELLQLAGLRRIRLHDLRHTCATLLLAQGVPARLVMEVLGHSGISLTMNTYTHVMPTMLRDATDHMDRIFQA
ncbi:tyrosine-type recombinase/integrase [Kineococcus sp. SYSU DK005]|uniref:tyrosine-type recombinase/integrase n=1 Tax=Kineococcus sp. SYSU DK005 TaxID=3383126 RepID=UPI003D7F0535